MMLGACEQYWLHPFISELPPITYHLPPATYHLSPITSFIYQRFAGFNTGYSSSTMTRPTDEFKKPDPSQAQDDRPTPFDSPSLRLVPRLEGVVVTLRCLCFPPGLMPTLCWVQHRNPACMSKLSNSHKILYCKHFQDLIAIIVDHLHRNLAAFRAFKGFALLLIQHFPGIQVHL